MGKIYAQITDRLEAFIARQHIFFVATAPLEDGGHVNVSPKGQDTFAILDPHTVAYQYFFLAAGPTPSLISSKMGE